MSIEAVIDQDPVWQDNGEAPGAECVILSLCNVGRNLRDIPFPGAGGAGDREAVEERVLDVLEKGGLLETGEYFHLPDLDAGERQLLAERQLITLGLTEPRKGQGAYISGDQCLSILVNDEDHCCIRVLASGLNIQQTWSRASALDDQLNEMLDFAYTEQFGFLTRNLDHAGTGLKLSLLMHLPACGYERPPHDGSALDEVRATAEQLELEFSGVGTGMPDKYAVNVQDSEARRLLHSEALYTTMNGFVARGLNETTGDLFQLRNRTTLGHTEEELVFRLKQGANEIIQKESALRDQLRAESGDILEDRVERARALATSARLIPFDESFTLLSSLRLGVTLGLIPDHTLADLNGSLIHCQGAHIERRLQPGAETPDELSLKRLRARQFKQLFTPARGEPGARARHRPH